MTDSAESDVDVLPNNMFTFQNGSTLRSKGPNINSMSISGPSFRINNMLSSTMQMPRNFDTQMYREPVYNERSLYTRRETSPMSMYSGSGSIRNHFNMSYQRGMHSQRSLINGRSGSPMSVRSIDSNVSVIATEIAMAFRNEKFNKYDLQIIKEAYNKFVKSRVQKKIGMRRKGKWRKGNRRKSSNDSADQGSDSSLSSDDCKSIRTTFRDDALSCRSTRTDISHFRRMMKDNSIYKDCTQSFRLNSMKNMFSFPQRSKPQFENRINVEHTSVFGQRDRSIPNFPLPCHRFNRSEVTISEKHYQQNKENSLANGISNNIHSHINGYDSSEEDEIFSEVTLRENMARNQTESIRKRNLDKIEEIDTVLPERKKAKTSPKKAKMASKTCNIVVKSSDIRKCSVPTCLPSNDFVFVKPTFPVRKIHQVKTKEKIIAQSPQKVTKEPQELNTKQSKISKKISPIKKPEPKVMANSKQPSKIHKILSPIKEPEAKLSPAQNEKSTKLSPIKDKPKNDKEETSLQNINEVSMRPSFIKRKLFTQKLDVTENKCNISCDALSTNSPQASIYKVIQNEKHKARKLVTTQSCLNRDIAAEDNYVLDLIHKIVPREHMNITNAENKSGDRSKVNQTDYCDKWDVTSIISTCNNDDISDTYTDEEIFNMDSTARKPVETKTNQTVKVSLNRLPTNVIQKKDEPTIFSSIEVPKKATGKQLSKGYNCVKTFWDIDYESDLEGTQTDKVGEEKNIGEGGNGTSINKDNSLIEEKKTDVNPQNNIGMKRFTQIKLTKPQSRKLVHTPPKVKQNKNIGSIQIQNDTVSEKAKEATTVTGSSQQSNKSSTDKVISQVTNKKRTQSKSQVVLTPVKQKSNLNNNTANSTVPKKSSKVNASSQLEANKEDKNKKSSKKTESKSKSNIPSDQTNKTKTTKNMTTKTNIANSKTKVNSINTTSTQVTDSVTSKNKTAVKKNKKCGSVLNESSESVINQSKNTTKVGKPNVIKTKLGTPKISNTKLSKTVRRSHRTPKNCKQKNCCDSPSLKLNHSTLYRSLRSRDIDLSSSYNSDKSPLITFNRRR